MKIDVSGQMVAPSLAAHLSHVGQGGVQALAHDFTAPQPDFVDPMRLLGIAAVAHVVDQEHPNRGQRQECFACPLLDQVWRGHDDSGKRFAVGMDEHHAQGDQGLAGSALRNHMRTSRNLPAPGHAHDGQSLCWIGLAKQSRDSRGRRILGTVQRRIREQECDFRAQRSDEPCSREAKRGSA